MNTIIKRDKTVVPFDRFRIIEAIQKAAKEVENINEKNFSIVANNIALEIEKSINAKDNQSITVEDIQDQVENKLMEVSPEVAKTFVKYRYKREVAREYKNDFIDAIKTKLTAADVQNQNANVDEQSFGGRLGEAANLMSKTYTLNYLLSKKSARNHLNNEIYIHDLDAYVLGSHNCLSIPYDDLLKNGFSTRQGDIRPANSVSSAL